MLQLLRKELAFVIEDTGGEGDIVAERAENELSTLLQLAQRRVHVWVWLARDLHHAPKELLRIYFWDLGWLSSLDCRATSATERLILCDLREVFTPYLRLRELCFEQGKPVIVQFDLAALDELPRASVVRTFLYRIIYVTNRDLFLDLVVEDCLERAYYLLGQGQQHVERASRVLTYNNASDIEEDCFGRLCRSRHV